MPALGTMPVLGALFRCQAFKRGQTELVIIVTPVIVNPTSGRRIATPVDNFVPPNDFERILLGRFQGNPRGREPVQNSHRPAPPRRPVRLRLRVRATTMTTPPASPVRAARAGPRLRSSRSPPARSSRSARSGTPSSSPPAAARMQSVYFQPGSAALRPGEAERLRAFLARPAPHAARPTSCSTSAAPARRSSTRGAAARSAPASRGRRRGCGSSASTRTLGAT